MIFKDPPVNEGLESEDKTMVGGRIGRIVRDKESLLGIMSDDTGL